MLCHSRHMPRSSTRHQEGSLHILAYFFFFFFKCFLVTILVFIIIVFTLSDDEGWMEQGGRRGDLILLESVAVLCGLPHFPVF